MRVKGGELAVEMEQTYGQNLIPIGLLLFINPCSSYIKWLRDFVLLSLSIRSVCELRLIIFRWFWYSRSEPKALSHPENRLLNIERYFDYDFQRKPNRTQAFPKYQTQSNNLINFRTSNLNSPWCIHISRIDSQEIFYWNTANIDHNRLKILDFDQWIGNVLFSIEWFCGGLRTNNQKKNALKLLRMCKNIFKAVK